MKKMSYKIPQIDIDDLYSFLKSKENEFENVESFFLVKLYDAPVVQLKLVLMEAYCVEDSNNKTYTKLLKLFNDHDKWYLSEKNLEKGRSDYIKLEFIYKKYLAEWEIKSLAEAHYFKNAQEYLMHNPVRSIMTIVTLESGTRYMLVGDLLKSKAGLLYFKTYVNCANETQKSYFNFTKLNRTFKYIITSLGLCFLKEEDTKKH